MNYGSADHACADETMPLMLRYDCGGSGHVVKSLQFSPDGKTLYVAGWSKLIQVYQLNEATGEFEYQPRYNLRVPVDVGRAGILETMALSADGNTLAVAGSSWSGVQECQTGYLFPRSSADDTLWKNTGRIFVFDIQTRQCRILQGHQGAVRQLTFVTGDVDQNELVSLGFEYSGKEIRQSVRRWSLKDNTPVGQPLDLPHVLIPPGIDLSPRLLAWKPVDGASRIATGGWNTEKGVLQSDLRIWDAQQKNHFIRISDAPVPFAFQILGAGAHRTLFCGGIGISRHYTIPDTGIPNPAGGLEKNTSVPQGDTSIPFAAAAIPDANLQTAAVISIRTNSDGSRACLLSVAGNQRTTQIGTLWTIRPNAGSTTSPLIEPALTVSPDGKYIAVAGMPNHEVRIYDLPTLLQQAQPQPQPVQELTPRQSLSHRMLIPDSAAFVERGNDRGIAWKIDDRWNPVFSTEHLNSFSAPHGSSIAANFLVADAQGRVVSPAESNWKVSRSSPGDYRMVISEDRHQIEISMGTDSGKVLRLPSDFQVAGAIEQITASAVCQRSNENPALAAVATDRQGEPFLHVFDASSGVCLREFRGHELTIVSLAFSGDGSQLISASLDGTVRVWRVVDLARETAGKIGRIRGFQISDQDAGLYVVESAQDYAGARSQIFVGDELLGVNTSDGLKKFSSAQEFYLWISQTSPTISPTVELRLRRKDQEFAVEVPLEQGIDVRSPLFSMLVSGPDSDSAGQEYPWLVWSSAGKFDFEGRKIEQQLGWQINTQNPRAPVSFTSVDQYRDRFREFGLMDRLLRNSEVSFSAPDPADMKLSLVTETGQIDDGDTDQELILTGKTGQLVLEFPDPSGEQVQSIEWWLKDLDSSPRQFRRTAPDIWISDIASDILSRSAIEMMVRLVTRDSPPREVTRRFKVRSRPGAPQIRLISPSSAVSHSESELYTIQAEISCNVPVEVSVIRLPADETETSVPVHLESSGPLMQSVELRPGRNVFRVTAVNRGVMNEDGSSHSAETASAEAVIHFHQPGPPRFTLQSVEQNQEVTPFLLKDGHLQVEAEQIRIIGSVESPSLLRELSLHQNGVTRAFTDFSPGQQRRVEFSETLQLIPGEQELIMVAGAGGTLATLPVKVIYAPPLPDIRLISPRSSVVELDQSQSPAQITVKYELRGGSHHQLRYQVLVNGVASQPDPRQVAERSNLVEETLSIPATSDVPEQRTRIVLKLLSPWNQVTSAPVFVRFRHRPEIHHLEIVREKISSVAKVVCHVATPASLPVMDVSLAVNGTRITSPHYLLQQNKVSGRQQLVFSNVALQQGDNRISVSVINSDGVSEVKHISEHIQSAPRPPEIRTTFPIADTAVLLPRCRVSFEVLSDTALHQADIVTEHPRQTVERVSLLDTNPANSVTATGKLRRHQFEEFVTLSPGVNRIRIEVTNQGGLSTREFQLSYVAPPVMISLNSVDSSDRPADNSIPFDSTIEKHVPHLYCDVNSGVVTLRGDIRWQEGQRPPGDSWTVRIWVNGFMSSARTEPPDETLRRAEFRIPIVLNLPQNRIRVEAPEVTASYQRLPQQDQHLSLLQNVIVECREPERRQRLYLLLMGVEMRDGRNVCSASELEDSARAALRLNTPESAFSEIILHPPLVGENAVRRLLQTATSQINSEITRRKSETGINDVVMFYYRGCEHAASNGEFLLEDFDNAPEPAKHQNSSITEKYLASLFDRLPGAHVVFLDVLQRGDGTNQMSGWKTFPNLGLFRLASRAPRDTGNSVGPLLTALTGAKNLSHSGGSISLGTLEQYFKTQFSSQNKISPAILQTEVPVDLAPLEIARDTAKR